ncbi:MAG: hypothetical protein Fur0010_07320 [Bdellovibrio sp.]
MKTLMIFVSSICFSLYASEATDTNEQRESFWSQLGQELASPVTTKANLILAGSLVAGGMVYLSQGRRAYDKRESFKDARPLGNYGFIGETIGWGYLNALYFIGHMSYGLYNANEVSIEASEHMFKASLYTLMATGALKTIIKEKRPGYPEDRASFPSGHSSMSFAFASVVASRHGWAYGSMAYGVATYISISRINDDWHYLHDILIGMGIGASYGWGLHYAYANGLPYQFTLMPLPKMGLGVLVSFDY